MCPTLNYLLPHQRTHSLSGRERDESRPRHVTESSPVHPNRKVAACLQAGSAASGPPDSCSPWLFC